MKLTEIVIMTGTLDASGVKSSAFLQPGKQLGILQNKHKVMIYNSVVEGGKAAKKISIINDQNVECALVVGIFFKKFNHTFFKIDRAWTEPQYRGQGIMKQLLTLLKQIWKVAFMSDRDLTQDGLGIWKRLKTDWNVSIYDGATNQYIPWSSTSEKELFVPEEDFNQYKDDPNHPINKKANRYYLVSEACDITRANGIPHVSRSILTPLIDD